MTLFQGHIDLSFSERRWVTCGGGEFPAPPPPPRDNYDTGTLYNFGGQCAFSTPKTALDLQMVVFLVHLITT